MDRYAIVAKVYNFQRKHDSFTYVVHSADTLRTAQMLARCYISSFNAVCGAPQPKLYRVWIERDGRKFPVYG